MPSLLSGPFRPFRHRAYLIIWVGAFISNIGTWIESIAVGVYVTEATGRASWTGTTAALTFLPTVIFGPFAGATGTSALVTAQGVGAVLAALAAGPLGARFGSKVMLVSAVSAVGPAAVLYGLAPTFPLALAAVFVLGFVYLGVLSGVSVVCQLRAPRELRARTASLFMLVLGGGYPLGLVLHGWLGDRFGLRPVTVTGGLALLAVVVAVRLLAPRQIDALAPPAEPGAVAAVPVEPALPEVEGPVGQAPGAPGAR